MWNCSSLFGFSGGGGFHPWGGMLHLLFWAALILFVVWVVKRVTPQSPRAATPGADATTILDNRLARGEISPEEYRATKQTLNKG